MIKKECFMFKWLRSFFTRKPKDVASFDEWAKSKNLKNTDDSIDWAGIGIVGSGTESCEIRVCKDCPYFNEHLTIKKELGK